MVNEATAEADSEDKEDEQVEYLVDAAEADDDLQVETTHQNSACWC